MWQRVPWLLAAASYQAPPAKSANEKPRRLLSGVLKILG